MAVGVVRDGRWGAPITTRGRSESVGYIRPPHSPATLQERMKMKVDWDELKRLHEAAISVETYTHFENALVRQFPAILAERSAAQRLRDAIDEGNCNCCGKWGISPAIMQAVAAFDKETQSDNSR